MPQLRIALAQVNPTVGDLAGNAATVVEWTRKAVEAGAHLVVFPEMVLTGYPVEDLAMRASFGHASRAALDSLAVALAEAGCGDIPVWAGYLDLDDVGPRNAAAVLHGGTVVARQYKHHLPNFGVFDERRYFVPGQNLDIVKVRGLEIGMAICEDIWQEGGPIAGLGRAGVDLVVSPNASPYERDKDDIRLPLVARRAREAGAPLVYVNQVGGQDDLVFDGDSMVVGVDGTLLARAPQFVEHLMVIDMDIPGGATRTDAEVVDTFTVRRVTVSEDPVPGYEPQHSPGVAEPLPDEAEVWSALVTGLRDYAQKNGFRSVVMGLSGGIDSAVCAALSVDALGADAVYGVSMPSVYSSDHSRSDAADLAERTGVHYSEQPIAGMVEQFVGQLGLTGLAEENVQARCRGVTLMGLSNQHGHLVLATGNKTELAVGYSTIYGDAVGGFAPIKDVPKTLVWELAKWRNAEAEKRGEVPPIPENSIVKPPSAELRPGQMDSDSLPDYELLDAVLDDYIEGDRGYDDLIKAGFDPELIDRVLRMVDRAEYKRRQYPPGTKISFKAFGRDRRLPITSAWREGS
ncbi:NAD+ synthase (glutamine-hydrolysing) [Actinokineospora alba]|uniref:Glutamine-dependent NAD(+) synthetase n=1 Tax=Actinokineospora alba TaxID=504798 RepID=A0A1H0VXH6_9PSEU|nr:NAD+ synthase [Actinokineospora alba]TDP67141.1 NAD+ synthase (glutamine-hydrolysing) [Actinokineospora alba]SDJ45893.1 NAD+ synthase (glutamine-hydrolysing) [Actinokineospora alba]SDP82918.1 NAD+ synthase (glutamine-hydrolysing) [Actinokineospora alba]